MIAFLIPKMKTINRIKTIAGFRNNTLLIARSKAHCLIFTPKHINNLYM